MDLEKLCAVTAVVGDLFREGINVTNAGGHTEWIFEMHDLGYSDSLLSYWWTINLH